MPFTYECAGCGTTVIKPTRLKGRAFCSSECYHRSTIKHHDRECPGCGTIFNPRKRGSPQIRNLYRTYCTRECFEASIRRWVPCARCGKPFMITRYDSLKQRYCSSECRWPLTYLDCKTCNTRFRVSPGEAEGTRQFCSVACYRRHTGETVLESRVRRALENLGIGFVQEYAAGRWAIDFAIIEHRIAIEADGEYWHTVTAERDAKRDAQLSRAGWRIVRLAETDVNATRDVGAFILDRLREATGLELADLMSPDGPGLPAAIRPAFHLSRKQVRRRGSRRPAAGQMPLWG